MSTAELKLKIIEKITDSENDLLLKDILRFFEMQDDSVYVLSPDELSAVSEAQAQYKRGEFYTHEDEQKESDRWLAE